jgi:hypothetical protein
MKQRVLSFRGSNKEFGKWLDGLAIYCFNVPGISVREFLD